MIEELSEAASRLNIVFLEFMEGKRYGNGTGPFAKELGTSKSTIQRMLRDEVDISYTVLTGLAKMGYSPEWVVSGTGDKKISKRPDDHVSIDQLIIANQVLAARQDKLEKEIAYLKSMMNATKKTGKKRRPEAETDQARS